MQKTIFWRGSVTSRVYYLGGNSMIGFGNYTNEIEFTEITTLADPRLEKINPKEEGFFDKVLSCKTTNKDIKRFIKAVAEVKGASLETFYRVRYDPTEVGDHMVAFQKSKRPATAHSYKWWVETASKMSPVEGRQWHIATEYQYYAFLVWLINQLVKSGKSVKKALHQVVVNSKKLGHNYSSKNSKKGKELEYTGARCVCGMYDLGNTTKMLQCSNSKAGGWWIAGCNCVCRGNFISLANLLYTTRVDDESYYGVGLLVLF